MELPHLHPHPHSRGKECHAARAILRPTRVAGSWRRAAEGALCLAAMLLLACQRAAAQLAPPDDFFNSGAQFYISNNIPAALERTETGLKLYPDNAKLKKLEELLKQKQQSQQNQQQQNQQNQQKRNQNQQQQKQEQQNQKQQNQQPQKQNQQNQAQQQKQQTQNEQGNAQAMTPEEAKRLLDAQKDNEQFLQMKPQGKPEDENQPVKDW